MDVYMEVQKAASASRLSPARSDTFWHHAITNPLEFNEWIKREQTAVSDWFIPTLLVTRDEKVAQKFHEHRPDNNLVRLNPRRRDHQLHYQEVITLIIFISFLLQALRPAPAAHFMLHPSLEI